ncbi:flap endonuclease GEN homolog 1 isoform X1 [Corvus moneduloides]|uniref:Flap endonuclease GEN homolog 1 n=2 Tax=Corvus moneduloides TaxID=1196302 RepID=A0A8U7MK32_CORMO|nr:flap endonuclease GEN homolog 1 isoform X1 [Corvus moneduloides]XP_031960004.1 flap endonuclease GEN homolog 1 isoform X1 [Corvus moneduloides]XP_031960005.1 flap endonuclease GEN homolog 1 isoform X1 [Corvus moneduloides]XP_031960006.1 flap endonuclease GEN homolog 1 isoform X1 [Corvus moneduloides]
MGVTYLWQILEPVRQPVNLSSLRGKTLAVDLSLWVCEAQTVKKMIGVVTKPHLRNLFFRFSFFTSMGIKLVFVMEGEAPRLKADTMSKRNEMRYGPSKKVGAARTGRSLFKAMLKECLELLECLGVPWVQAAGEAEAMCAYLNAKGHVDGCITNDGDVFLYGALTVYRNFAMNAKDPHLDCYTMSSIKEKLGCDRESLIGLGVLLGCDYLPKGVPGVGKEQALKLVETLRGQNLLQRFEQWKEQFQCDDNPPLVVKRVIHCSECHHPGSYKEHEHNGCKFCETVRCCKPSDSKHCCPCAWHQLERVKQANAVEDSIRKKAKSCEGFPFSEVIQEFLVNKNKLISIKECRRPNLLSFQIFASEKMEWTKHYACKKLLGLLTCYDMIQRKSGYIDSKQLQAIRIVKTRIKNGIPCFEIEWQKPEHYVDPEDEPVELFVVTVEEESLFQAAYPDIVALYQEEKSEVLQKKQKKRKNRPEGKELPNACDEVTNLLSQINLKPTNRILPVKHSMSNTKAPSEDQTQQRSTGSKDAALAAASCLTAVHMPASAALADSSVPSQSTKYSEISSSVPAGLQLSSTDGKGTSFSTSLARGGDDHDPAVDLTTCIKHSHPLGHETVRNSSEYSDVTQSDMHSGSEDDLFSNDAMGQLQEWSLSERILKKAPIPSQPLSEDVTQLASLKCFKQTKETLHLGRNYVSSSCQLNKPVQDSKNVLSENSASESSVHIYPDEYKKADILAEMVQKGPYISSSTSLAFSGRTTETLLPGCDMLPASQKPADATGCHIKEACIETTWKASSKKSVCQNRCSSSEDSDEGHVDKILIYEQQKRQLNPAQFKKCFTKKWSSVVTSKRTNSDSALTIKGKKKTTSLKKDVNSFSVQVSPKPSSVQEVNCSQSPEQPVERLGSDPTQQDKRAVLNYAWADSPLPLSERLKGRLKIN